jgi:hypothetical protein
MKITKRQLKRIIRESLLREGVDTDVYEGDHDPITVEIPALESLATKENFDGKKVWFGDSDAYGIADVLEDEEPQIEDYNYDDAEHEEALSNWNKIHDALDGWNDSDKEELATNIRKVVKETEDSGYEY